MELGYYDTISGTDWMKSQNLVPFDFEKMHIILKEDGKPVSIQGVKGEGL